MVLTGELLKGLDEDSSPHSEALASGAVTEAVKVSRRSEGSFMVERGSDLSEFLGHGGGILGSR